MGSLVLLFEAEDRDKNYDVVCLDFTEAFDKVPHHQLLLKLQVHGLEGEVFYWVRATLCNRKQRVQINGKRSDWSCATIRLPQGWVLVPLSFILILRYRY